MAQFRGTVRGDRGEASRQGSKASGLHASAASWAGAVHVRLADPGQVAGAEGLKACRVAAEGGHCRRAAGLVTSTSNDPSFRISVRNSTTPSERSPFRSEPP